MSRKKKFLDSWEPSLWKENGPEQKILEDLFATGLITEKDTPATAKKKDSSFSKFSSQVFAAHFRKTKKKMDQLSNENEIPEISGLPENYLTPKRTHQATSDQNICEQDNISFLNPPITTWTYTNHTEKCIKVFVAIPMFTGVRNINFELSENAEEVTFKYQWPKAMYRAQDLFKEEIKNQTTSLLHPKIYSFTCQLFEQGITENSDPWGKIIIKLPIKVQKEIGSWGKKGVKTEDGTWVVIVEFKGFQEQQILIEADTNISFD